MNAFPQDKSVLVTYSIPEKGRVAIEEFSLNGSRAKVLFDGFREAGNYFFTCDINRFSSNLVLLKISYKGYSKVKRMVLVK